MANKVVRPSTRIGRFEMENLSLVPDGTCRYRTERTRKT